VGNGWGPDEKNGDRFRAGSGGSRDDAGLCRPPDISMTEATDFGNLHDGARVKRLDGPAVRGILLECEVSARAMIVGEVCVQKRQTCSVGGSPTGVTARRPVAWMAGRRETKAGAHRRNHRKDGSEWPGCNVSERKGSLEKRFRRPSAYFTREGSRDRRSLADATSSLRRGMSDGTARRTRQATGEALLVPPRNRRSWVGRITGFPRESDRRREGGGRARGSDEAG
jgi:hypothetical protein